VSNGALSFLGQAATQPTSFQEIFISVNFAYGQADLAMTTARTGYNFDVAKKEIDDAARWATKAYSFIQKAETEGFINPSERVELLQNVMSPLNDVISQIRYGITARSQNWLVRYWEAFKDASRKIIAGTTGFFGERWQKVVLTYALVSKFVQNSDKLLAISSQIATTTPEREQLQKYKSAIDRIKIAKQQIETTMNIHGVPLKALQEEAGKAQLGAAQILAAPVITIAGVVITVGTIATITAYIVSFILFDLLFQFIFAIVSLARLETVRLGVVASFGKVTKRVSVTAAQAAYDAAVNEAVKAAGAISESQQKRVLDTAMDLSIAMAQKLLEVSGSPKITKEQFDEKLEEGISEAQGKTSAGNASLVLIGVALFALGVYIYSRRK